MLIARLSNGTLILGITRENIDRLIAGKPIRITHATHGLDMPFGVPCIGIMFGETTDAIQAQLLDASKATN